MGECACVSVHGANRLGSNSLLDLVVFGRAAGLHIIKHSKNQKHKALPKNAAEFTLDRIESLDKNSDGESPKEVGDELRKVMQDHCGVFRFPELLEKGLSEIQNLRKKTNNLEIKDKSKVFNTARTEALEISNLIEVAEATMNAALTRQESRGAHSRFDFPNRDDQNWLKHSLYNPIEKTMSFRPVNLKPLTVESFPLKERVY